MDGFILINQSNYKELLGLNGAIELAICFASYFISILLSKIIYKEINLFKKFPSLTYKNFNSFFIPLIFSIILSILSLAYTIITDHKTILGFSIAFFSIAIYVINLITLIAKISFKKSIHHDRINNLLKSILLCLMLVWATHIDEWVVLHLSNIYLSLGDQKLSILLLLKHISFIIIAFILMFFLGGIVNWFIYQSKNSDATQKQLLSRITKILIILLGVYIILPSMGINITALTVFGSALGVGIGFGLQKISSNFLSGFIILLDKSVKIGDKIVLNGTTGVISKITTRYTVMQAFDGSEVIIPNEQFITNTIINQTHSNSDMAVELNISVSYDSNLNEVINTIKECVVSVTEIRQDKTPFILIKTLNSSGIDIFIRVWPNDSLKEADIVNNKLYISIVEKFKEKNIEIPFPKLDVKMEEINKN